MIGIYLIFISQDQRKEVELMDDCVAEALTKRAVPITIITSVATYMAIRNGFLRVSDFSISFFK